MSGKIAKVQPLRFTPAGDAILELILAVKQKLFGKAGVGNFSVLCSGQLALDWGTKLKIGHDLRVLGSLWTRRYRSKEGEMRDQILIVAEELLKDSAGRSAKETGGTL